RDLYVTGVQTCALPISGVHVGGRGALEDGAQGWRARGLGRGARDRCAAQAGAALAGREAGGGEGGGRFADDVSGGGEGRLREARSEERRVGKECRAGRS